jgi:hypothetical protein
MRSKKGNSYTTRKVNNKEEKKQKVRRFFTQEDLKP